MSDTTYVDYTTPPVNAAWLNEINDHVWHDTPVIGTTIHSSSVIGFSQSETGAVQGTAQTKLRQIKTSSDYDTFDNFKTAAQTNAFFVQNGAKVAAFGDRLFAGAAVENDGKYPGVNLDWLALFQIAAGYPAGSVGSLGVSQGGILTDTSGRSGSAWCVGAQSKYSPNSDVSTIGTQSYVINNNTTFGTNVWSYYGEAHITSAAVGGAYGMEIDTRTLFPTVAPTPFQQGSLIGHQIASGCGIGSVSFTGSMTGSTTLTVTSSSAQIGASILPGNFIRGVGITEGTTVISQLSGTTGGDGTYQLSAAFTVTARHMTASNQYDASAAIQIAANALKWRVGINFMADSLVGCDGTQGGATALSLSKGHYIQWFNNIGAAVGRIYTSTDATTSSGVSLGINSIGLQLSGMSNNVIAYFSPVASSVNYLSFSGAVSTGAPYIGAFGSDTNVDLQLTCQGTGVLRFGTYTAGVVAQAGYITIKDIGGNIRRLLIG